MKLTGKFKPEANESGFTLIEILVVILIIGILAAIAIPVFLNQRQTANDAAVESDVKNAVPIAENYFSNKGPNDSLDLAYMKVNAKKSTGVTLRFQGTANDYCIWGVHSNGAKHVGGGWVAPTPRPYFLYSSKNGGFVKDMAAGYTHLSCSSHGDPILAWV